MLTISKLRADIYRIFDNVLATGEPVEVERKGRRLRIQAVDDDVVDEATPSKLDRLVPHTGAITGDPDDIDKIGWADAWQP